jgi:phosphate/phosphite/phosphonate ABC transporter binding protein
MDDLVFAVTWQRKGEPLGQRMNAFTRWLGEQLGCRVVPKVSLSYEELREAVRKEDADIAWLPPIVSAVLEREGKSRGLLVSERIGSTLFHCVIVCADDAPYKTIKDLAGARAAWVDPWSASGYVLPRLHVHQLGVDAAKAFLEERFLGSHDAAVQRVLQGQADVTATYANLDADGHVTSAGWRAHPDARGKLRILAVVGAIPSDVIAARATLDPDVQARIASVLQKGIESPASRAIIQEAFDVTGFRPPTEDDRLHRSLEKAIGAGLFPYFT